MRRDFDPGRRWALALFGQAGLVLGGCSVLSSEAPTLYVLSPKNTFSNDLPQVTTQMVVTEPFAAAGLDTDRKSTRLNSSHAD